MEGPRTVVEYFQLLDTTRLKHLTLAARLASKGLDGMR